ncbi:MAG: tail fiber domain-containing protein [Terracidiphilus sp.]
MVPIGRIAKDTPYSADFLRQLARSGRIRAYKFHRDWLTTPEAVLQYMQDQQERHRKALTILQTAEKAFLTVVLMIITFSAVPKARAQDRNTSPVRSGSTISATLHNLVSGWQGFASFYAEEFSAVFRMSASSFGEEATQAHLALGTLQRFGSFYWQGLSAVFRVNESALAQQADEIKTALLWQRQEADAVLASLGGSPLGKTSEGYRADAPAKPLALAKHPTEPRGPEVSPSSSTTTSELTDGSFNQQPRVLGLSTTGTPQPSASEDNSAGFGVTLVQIQALIDQTLARYVASGAFTGPQGPQGASGASASSIVQNGNGQTTAVIGGNPIVTYVPAVPTSNFSGTSLAGFGTLSAGTFTSGNTTIGGTLNVSGPVFVSNLTNSGNEAVGGALSAATSTLASLTVSGPATFTGSTTIAGLTVTGLNPGLAVGSVAFQGASGLAQDNANLFYDSTDHFLGLGTTTPSQLLTVAGNGLFTGQLTVAGPAILGTTTIASLTVNGNSISGTNSGDVTLTGQNYLSLSGQQIAANAIDLSGSNATGILAAGRFPALTGDVTTSAGSLTTTLATVNSTVGSFGGASQALQITVNGKGLVTAVSTTTPSIPVADLAGNLPIASGGTGATTATGASANLQFVQTGTGALARSLSDKLTDIVSVKDFGATGNGVTNDAAAIQAALNSGSSDIAVPPGTYVLGATGITVPSSVKQFIVSAGALLTYSGTGTAITVLSNQMTDISVRVMRTSIGWPTTDQSSVGVKLENQGTSNLEVDASNFYVGVQLDGDASLESSWGFVNSTIHLGNIEDNQIGLDFHGVNGGYVNQNTVIGGSISLAGFSGQQPSTQFIDMCDGEANANTIIGTDTEGNQAVYALNVCHNSNNLFENVRFEAVGVGSVFFDSASLANTLIDCYGISAAYSNIVNDQGQYFTYGYANGEMDNKYPLFVSGGLETYTDIHGVGLYTTDIRNTNTTTGSTFYLDTPVFSLRDPTQGSKVVLTYNTLNVGIGTATPAQALTIQGSGSYDLLNVVNTGGASALYVANSGNVGIGTTSPASTLAVNGSLFVATTTNTSALTIAGLSGTQCLHEVSGVVSGTGSDCGSGGGSLSGGAAGYDALWTGPSTLSTGIILNSAAATGLAGINATSSNYTFDIEGSAGIAPLNVASSSGASLLAILGNGNVGIGTSTPNALLVVATSTSTKILSVGTNGDVGIDNANPAYALDVVGGINASGSITTPLGAIGAGGSPLASTRGTYYTANTGVVGLIVRGYTSQTADLQDWQSIAPATLSEIDSQGYMGIGYTSPGTAALAINGNVGIGTTSPSSRLTVWGADTGADLLANFVNSASTTLMSILNNGNVGIGTSSPQYVLQAGNSSISGIVARFQNTNGTCDVNPTTGTLACSSDARLKKNITPMGDDLSQVMTLQPVYFNWNAEASGTPEHPGFVAQQVQQVMPEVVSTDPTTGLLSIGYSDLVPAVVSAMQQMQAEITALQGSLNGNASSSDLAVYVPSSFSGDSVGEAEIPAGQSSVRVSFSKAYEYQPVVTVTAVDVPTYGYVSDVNSTGFTVNLPTPVASEVVFDWHSFASPNEQLTVSGGTTQPIVLVVASSTPTSEPQVAVVSDATDSSSTSQTELGSPATSTPAVPWNLSPPASTQAGEDSTTTTSSLTSSSVPSLEAPIPPPASTPTVATDSTAPPASSVSPAPSSTVTAPPADTGTSVDADSGSGPSTAN